MTLNESLIGTSARTSTGFGSVGPRMMLPGFGDAITLMEDNHQGVWKQMSILRRTTIAVIPFENTTRRRNVAKGTLTRCHSNLFRRSSLPERLLIEGTSESDCTSSPTEWPFRSL